MQDSWFVGKTQIDKLRSWSEKPAVLFVLTYDASLDTSLNLGFLFSVETLSPCAADIKIEAIVIKTFPLPLLPSLHLCVLTGLGVGSITSQHYQN